MKKISLLFVAIALTISSCDNNPISCKLWYGEIIRVCDSINLSPIVLEPNGEELVIFANAIFGKSRSNFKLQGKENDNTFIYKGLDNDICIILKMNPDESLTLSLKPENGFYANFRVDDIKAKDFIINSYRNIDVAYNSQNYLINASLEGDLYRKDDDAKLSKCVLCEENDTIKIYSNAIFGANNNIINNTGFSKEFDCFLYSTNDLENFAIYSSGKGFRIEGDDYYAILKSKENPDISFYKKLNVSSNPAHYPKIGNVYSGNLESIRPNELSDALEMTTINFTVKFIDESSFSLNTRYEMNKDYIRKTSYFFGVDYNAAMLLFGSHKENEISYHKYYVEPNGNIIARNKKDNSKSVFVLSNNRNILRQTDLEKDGLSAKLKLK